MSAEQTRRTLIVGDVHGQLQRLENLLLQEGIIGPCALCAATGDISDGTAEAEFCPECSGAGLARIDHEIRVIQLGDLVDLMPARTSPTADEMVVTFADKWIDEFLWGNHERPLAPGGGPVFNNFMTNSSVQHRLHAWVAEKRLKLATTSHGFLVTHAGLSDAAFSDEGTGSLNRYNVEKLAAWINRKDPERGFQQKMSGYIGWHLRDNISWFRGGVEGWGGIIWRDSREGLWPVPQIFGHTSHEEPLTIEEDEGRVSYCIDTSKNGGLAAIMLENDAEPRLINIKDEEFETPDSSHDPILGVPEDILQALIV